MAGETETNPNPAPERIDLPETATPEEAVALMAGLEGGPEPPPVDPNARPRKERAEEAAGQEAQASEGEGEATEGEDAEEGEGEKQGEAESEAEAEQQEAEPAAADAPEFWSADDKALYAKVPPELRPVLAKYEQQRIAFVNEKTREAAGKVREAEGATKELYSLVAANAAWWQQNGPKLNAAYVDKWTNRLKEAGVASWGELADRDPGLWAKYEQERRDEAAAIAEAQRRGQADVELAQQQEARANAERVQTAKAEAHAAMLKEFPTAFADPDKIYNKTIGPYLIENGIGVDRINQISEAPILRIAYKAYLYDQGQKAKQQASAVLAGKTTPRTQPQTPTASATPTRVPPGAPVRGANRQGEAVRQVRERINRANGASINDAAELIRLSGL